MKNLYLSSCHGYQWENIKNWVVSLREVNKEDDIFIITYTKFDDNTLEKFKQYNVKYIYQENVNYRRIVVERFYSYFLFLNSFFKYNFVFLFDLADIVFQKNPSEWVQNNFKNKKIIAASECLKYKDEKWGRGNFFESFSENYDLIKEKTIYNAGTICGTTEEIKKLSYDIYKLCETNPCFNPDQAAYNLLIHTKYESDVLFTNMSDSYSCQCGTVFDPTRMEVGPWFYSKYLLEPAPKFDDNKVVNYKDEVFYIVHQYNRNDTLNNFFKNKYKDK